jgi:large subunit ribosomal protein L22
MATTTPTQPKIVESFTARLRYLHIAPRKVRLLADTVRGLPLQEAQVQLMQSSRRAKTPLLKLLKSAEANAKQKDTNLTSQHLRVKEIRVDNGPMMKRFIPRAMGRATPIQKKMSHITITLEHTTTPHRERFVIVPPAKKDKKPKKVKKPSKKTDDQATPGVKEVRSDEKKKESKPKKEQKGMLRKMFRRKNV